MAKPQKLKARLPRGLADRGPAEIAATRRMIETIRGVYELYGFEPVETPAIEYTDALGKFLPDQDRPNEGVFSFQDDDEQWLSLRYDLTAPLARFVAENYQHLALPYRSYREGWVFRNEKPGPGRFRQFMQFDADTVGSASPAADAEICMMAADTMEALGFKRDEYVVKVNNRKVLEGLRQELSILDDAKWLVTLRAIDKLDRLQVAGVSALLGKGRVDESGDFTKGADLNPDQIGPIINFVLWRPIRFTGHDPLRAGEPTRTVLNSRERLAALRDSFSDNELAMQGITELDSISEQVQRAGYHDDRILIDTSVVRGLEYYTGPVFEVELLIETRDEKGRPVRFGSVGGGGRYDGLVSRFMGQPVPATGFSIGVSRLQAALALIGKDSAQAPHGPVVVSVFDRERIADYQRMVAELRQANIRAELYLGNPKNMGAQFKYADKRNAPCVVVQGSDEHDDAAGEQVIVKDLIAGARMAAQEQDKDRDAYLQKQADVQTRIPRDKLVETVQEILERHGVRWAVAK